MTLPQLQLFHHLYERTAADLAKITTFPPNRKRGAIWKIWSPAPMAKFTRRAKNSDVFSRCNGFSRRCRKRFAGMSGPFIFRWPSPWRAAPSAGWPLPLTRTPKPVLMPFSHLLQDPAKRVAEEEKATNDRLAGYKTTFSAELMTHNTKVSIFTLALGMTWGFGTILMLFYNGVILGAVAVDYIRAGQTKFLLGWLMPHGVIEIPAILIAGQAGLMLALALIGRGSRAPLRSAVARNFGRRRHADFWRRRAAGLGGIYRSISLAISRTGHSLRGQNRLWRR